MNEINITSHVSRLTSHITYCEETKKRLENSFPLTQMAHHIGEIALRSILLELSASPKPGLVDRFNSGSHCDMNYETFLLSTASIAPYFVYMAQEGVEYLSSEPPDKLLPRIRTIGLFAEKKMFLATGNINTQKGIIFLLGLICGASGYLLAQKEIINPQKLSDFIRLICKDIVKNELLHNENPVTSGEKIFFEYGISGVRGEAEEGFPSVINYGFPALKEGLSSGLNLNDGSLHALCHIMAHLNDTALLHRHNLSTLRRVQSEMDKLCRQGGLLTDEGKRNWGKFDEKYNRERINPGGSADMLSVTLMFYFLEQSDLSGKL